MSSFVEDALKTTRNLHRLVITVSLVSLVFALSLSLPTDLVKIREQLNQLCSLDFSGYDAYASAIAKGFLKDPLTERHKTLTQLFEEGSWTIFQTNTIADAFLKPIHLGRIDIQQTILSEIDNASITQLAAITGALSLDQQVQVLVPDISELENVLTECFDAHQVTGARVENVRLGIDDYSFAAETFLSNPVEYAYLNFELVSGGPFEAVPIFNASFPAKVVEVPNSSLLYWLQNEAVKKIKFIVLRINRFTGWKSYRRCQKATARKRLGYCLRKSPKKLPKVAQKNKP